MHKRKAILILITVWAFVWFCTAVLAGFLIHGNFISKKTEEKYLRNIHLYKPISERQIYVFSDTLGYIAKVSLAALNPFYKYYLEDTGLIKRGSELEKKVDSVLNSQNHKNPYE